MYILSIPKKLDHVDSVDCVLDDKIFNQEYEIDFKVDKTNLNSEVMMLTKICNSYLRQFSHL